MNGVHNGKQILLNGTHTDTTNVILIGNPDLPAHTDKSCREWDVGGNFREGGRERKFLAIIIQMHLYADIKDVFKCMKQIGCQPNYILGPRLPTRELSRTNQSVPTTLRTK